MAEDSTRRVAWKLFCATSWVPLIASPAMAQTSEDVASNADAQAEIVVTAQRREQSIQDVPVTVTAIGGEDLKDLNIFRLDDVEQLSPGLELDAGSGRGFGASATLRGVTLDTNASALPAIDVYLNETPVDYNYAFQSLYDIGQIEVLRGPQGLFRGRPSPGGAITVTTRRPDLYDFGGYASASASDQDALNFQAALNIPVIRDQLAVRVAGAWDELDLDQTKGINAGDREDHRKSKSVRASVRWEPSDTFEANFMYQYLKNEVRDFQQVEGPGAGYNGPEINKRGYGVSDEPGLGTQKSEIATLNLEWDIGRHRLVYTGALQDNQFLSVDDLDKTNAVTNYAQVQTVLSTFDAETHELRLESIPDDGFVDYLVGLWYYKDKFGGFFEQPVPLSGAFGNPLSPSMSGPLDDNYVINASGTLGGKTENYAAYVNTVFHFGKRTDLSLGIRRLVNKRDDRGNSTSTSSALVAAPIIPGAPLDTEFPADFFFPGSPAGCQGLALVDPSGFNGNEPYAGYCDIQLAESTSASSERIKEKAWVGNVSLTHRFNDDLMVYVTYGHSWRPAGKTVAISGTLSDDLTSASPEKSDSFEAGIRSEWLNGKLRVNASIYHQKFKNFVSRFADVPYVVPETPRVQVASGFTYPADATVTGGEVEVAWDITDNWWTNIGFATTDAHYDNARVPCRDTNLDGEPDNGDVGMLDISDFEDNNVIYCRSDEAISNAPNWNLTAQSEYSFPAFGQEAYVRGLFNYQPKNDNGTPGFTRDAYGLLNLYVGLRDIDRAWEITLWAKNVLDDSTLLSRGTVQQAYDSFNPNYYTTSYTPPREFGITLRSSFGGG